MTNVDIGFLIFGLFGVAYFITLILYSRTLPHTLSVVFDDGVNRVVYDDTKVAWVGETTISLTRLTPEESSLVKWEKQKPHSWGFIHRWFFKPFMSFPQNAVSFGNGRLNPWVTEIESPNPLMGGTMLPWGGKSSNDWINFTTPLKLTNGESYRLVLSQKNRGWFPTGPEVSLLFRIVNGEVSILYLVPKKFRLF